MRSFLLPTSLALLLVLSLPSSAETPPTGSPQASPGFELVDGDCVALIGTTFIERERYEGYIETQLTLRYQGKKVRFRNLGWAGDTVDIQGRPLGFGDLEVQLGMVEPTVAFVSYGMNEAFEGPQGIPEFVAGYRKILDTLQASGIRSVVLLGPTPHEKKPTPLPDPEAHNASLKLYSEATRQVAKERGLPFVDLFMELQASPEWGTLTDNGIHLNSNGYREATRIIDSRLHPDQEIAVGAGMGGAEPEVFEDLRRAIIEKNQFFFYRWRAVNGEYIWGRRAQSSGDGYGRGNSGNEQFPLEMAEFDRLISEKESEISRLAKR